MAEWDRILDSPVTMTWLKERILCRLPREQASKVSLSSWTVELPGKCQGFVSSIIRVGFHWSEINNKLPKSVILKIPSAHKFKKVIGNILPEASEMMKGVSDTILVVYNAECTFYQLWEKDPPRLPIPVCYLAQEMSRKSVGVLIFEDLSQIMAQQPIGPGITLNQWMGVAENLATLHTWSLRNRSWIDKFRAPDKEIMKRFYILHSFNEIMFENIKSKFCPNYFDPAFVDRIKEVAKTFDDFWYQFSVHKEFNMPEVLVHGDMWVGNMMFKKDVDKYGVTCASDELLAVFDFQTCYGGCAAADFVRLSCTSIPGQLRREKLHTVMQHYYTVLKEKLGKQPPYTFDTLMKSYIRLMKAGFIGGIAVLTMILSGDPVIYGGINFQDEILIRAKYLLEDTLATLR